MSALTREYMAGVMAAIERDHWAGASALANAERLSGYIDDLLRFVFESGSLRFRRRYASTRQQCAIIALGGYGRREQCPASDVDLLVMYSGRVTPYLETVTEALLYALWDAKLKVGHAVRDTAECLSMAASDDTVKSAMLDGRFICGSPELASQFEHSVCDVISAADSKAFVAAKRKELEERHRQSGSSVFILEPNIKEGQGGLRDFHVLQWIARACRGVSRLEEFLEHNIVTRSEYEELAAAREFLFYTRFSLHLIAKGRPDELTFERQDIIADWLGYRGEGRNSAGDMFMRDYYRHAALLARSTEDIIERLVAPPEPAGFLERIGKREISPGLSVIGGKLSVEDGLFEREPLRMVTVFADCRRLDLELSPAAREALRRSVDSLNSELCCSDEAVKAFFSILKAKDGIYKTLALMHRLGVLGKMLPEFGRLFCMVQHDYHHIYTVDEHCLVGVRELELLREGAYAQSSPFITRTMRGYDRYELLFLAMLFHDLGKGYGGDHDEKGATMAAEAAARLKMNEDDIATLQFLVRNHLLMSMLAQERDINDMELVSDFVRQVGTAENLRLLYLLTFADMKAVGPTIWNGWRDHLLAELYRRSLDMFDRGIVTEADMELRVERIRARLVAAARGEDERRRLAAFVDSMPNSYFLAHSEEKVIDHWRLFESRGSAKFAYGVLHHPERSFTELTLCSADRPGLFGSVSGLLSARGLSVLDSRLATSSDGWAVEVFHIDHQESEDGSGVVALAPEVWDGFADDLDAVLSDRVDVAALVSQAIEAHNSRIGSKRSTRRSRARVGVDNQSSKQFTIIDVYAADRPFLLFLIANTIFKLGLNIHSAKVSTHLNEVLDVFYVTDAAGGKIEDPLRLSEIRETITRSIDGEGEDAAAASPGPVAL